MNRLTRRADPDSARSRQAPQASGTATHRCTRRCQARRSSTSPASATGRPAPLPALASGACRRFHPLGRGSHLRERLGDLVDRISWRWAAAGMADGGVGRRRARGDVGRRRRAIARRPRKPASVASPGSRSARRSPTSALPHARRLSRPATTSSGRRRRPQDRRGSAATPGHFRPAIDAHVVVAPASVPSSATTGSVETPTTATATGPG